MKKYIVSLCFLLPMAAAGQIDLLGGQETYAVIVGISEYQSPKITDLRFAHQDALAFREYLRSKAGGEVPEENIKILINEQATTSEISMSLDWLISKCKENDRAIIYFSGHGDVETSTRSNLGFLLTYNTLYNNYMAGAYPLFYLQNVISTLSQEQKANVILIADACHSGKLAGADVGGAQLTATQMTQQFANEIKLLSCGPEEFSLEDVKWGGGRGVFSYYLIEGLKGKADMNGDLEIQLYEIHNYLENIVPKQVEPESQFPLAIGRRSAHFAYVDPDAALAKEMESPSGMVVAAKNRKGMETSLDTTEQELFQFFEAAMAENKLIEPEGNSAYAFFRSLEKRKLETVDLEDLRRHLVSSLQTESQTALNAYLKADSEEMKKRWSSHEQYQRYPAYLEKAANLLGEKHYMYEGLRAKQFYFQSVVDRLDGKPESALANLQKAIELNPIGGHLYNELGLIYGMLDQKEAELQAYKQALTEAPTWVLPANNLSQVYGVLGEFEEAKKWGLKAVQLDPTFGEAWVQLGDAERNLGHLTDAETAYKNAVLFDSENALSHYRLGYLYHLQQDLEKAGLEYEKTLAIDPENELALTALGDLLYYQGEYENAAAKYRTAQAVNNENKYVLERLALASVRLNEMDTAIELFKSLAELEPENPAYAYNLACLFSKLEKNKDGFYWLETALENGYNKREKLEQDPDLAFLRKEPTFKILLDKYLKG